MKYETICETEITKRPLRFRLMPKWFLKHEIKAYEKHHIGKAPQEPVQKVIEAKGCKIFF